MEYLLNKRVMTYRWYPFPTLDTNYDTLEPACQYCLDAQGRLYYTLVKGE